MADAKAMTVTKRGAGASPSKKETRKRFALAAFFCLDCVIINIVGNRVAGALNLTMYLDCMGTMTAAIIGGPIPGVIVGYLTNLINAFFDTSAIFYGLVSVLIALAAWLMQRARWFERIPTIVAAAFIFAVIGGGVSSIITWWAFGFGAEGISSPLALRIYETTRVDPIFAQFAADTWVDLADKSVELLITLVMVRLLPQYMRDSLDFSLWRQAPLSEDERKAALSNEVRTVSLRTHVVTVVLIALSVIGSATSIISYYTYWNSMIDKQADYALGITDLAKKAVDPNRVDEYLELGEAAPGYLEVESQLSSIRESFEDVAYVYVYQIREDGCHVVLDPDTPDEPGADPGEVIAFDEAFRDQLSALLAGEEIEPVVSNESWGWLLSVYDPVVDDEGACKAYVCADILMDRMRIDSYSFLARIVSLFASFFILVCVITLWLCEYGVILPLNSISLDMASMSFEDETARKESLRSIHALDINTGDEVESLYHSIDDMVENTVYYISESERQTRTIARMQENLIIVLADLVESRDFYTGEHVHKTAAYVRFILIQMRKEGIYADQIDDEYIFNVVHSAPLHDIGKIVVSDAILNCPRRLTDEEFVEIKRHSIAGSQILERAVGAMSDPGYLDEARQLAEYHHEKWDGSGYPHGIAGEEIPLSARVMAVADVFDALVSKRSYKDGMPIDKAINIIRDNSGTHFDPLVVKAFLDAEDEIRAIAEQHGDASGTQLFDVHEEDAK